MGAYGSTWASAAWVERKRFLIGLMHASRENGVNRSRILSHCSDNVRDTRRYTGAG